MEARLLVTCVLMVVLQLQSLGAVRRQWRRDRAPAIYGSKVRAWQLDARYPKVQRTVTHIHNRFRSRVRPRAANMLKLHWHKGASRDAQEWANACRFLVHSNDTQRWQHNLGTCGQNIFVSTQRVPWYFAIKSWFMEKEIFRYGSKHNNLTDVGHYTQMVWFATHKVGCGWAYCPSKAKGDMPYYNYICNYCPSGNYASRLGRPYDAGKPCSGCRRACNRKKRLCTNSCPWTDVWSNCGQLKQQNPRWTCQARGKQGRSCRASCRCRHRIHN